MTVQPMPFPVTGVSQRNTPLAHDLTAMVALMGDMVADLQAKAAAAADNAIDEGQPINPELIEAWIYGLGQAAASLKTAGGGSVNARRLGRPLAALPRSRSVPSSHARLRAMTAITLAAAVLLSAHITLMREQQLQRQPIPLKCEVARAHRL